MKCSWRIFSIFTFSFLLLMQLFILNKNVFCKKRKPINKLKIYNFFWKSETDPKQEETGPKKEETDQKKKENSSKNCIWGISDNFWKNRKRLKKFILGRFPFLGPIPCWGVSIAPNQTMTGKTLDKKSWLSFLQNNILISGLFIILDSNNSVKKI